MCYTLSRRAMEIVARMNPTHWAEDLSVGKALREKRLKRQGHKGFIPGYGDHYVNIDTLPDYTIAAHAVLPEGMHRIYGK